MAALVVLPQVHGLEGGTARDELVAPGALVLLAAVVDLLALVASLV